MFGRARRKATEHTVSAIKPMIAVFQSQYGLPANFWCDEFVLGFVGFLISFHTNVTSGYKLSHADKGYVLADVFSSLSHINGDAIRSDYTRLARAEPKDAAFEEGADNASIITLASIGKTNEQGKDIYATAKDMAEAQGSPNDHGAIVGILMMLLFIEPLKDRFGIDD